MFSVADEDEFFNASLNTGSSNLASLFGTATITKQSDNSSLVYTAPKNPKINTEETIHPKPALQTSVICTAFVDVFTVTSNNTHSAQGKCGLAVIGNQNAKTYDIIIYKSKQDIFMRTKLKSDFTFIIKDDNFASFCDDGKHEWLVRFENLKDVSSFVDELRKRGVNVVDGLGKINGDRDAVSDTSNSHSRASILSRMAKMGQPILPTNVNTQIISDTKPIITDSETDEVESVKKPTVKKRHKIVANYGEPSMKPSGTPEYVVVNGQVLPISSLHSVPIPGQLLYPNPVTINPPQLAASPDFLNIFIAENRTHNCELRMNMTHISSKLDTILAKIDKTSTNIVETENTNRLQQVIAERDTKISEKQRLYETLEIQYDRLSLAASNNQEVINDYQLKLDNREQEIAEHRKKIEELYASQNEEALLREKQLQTINELNASATSTLNSNSEIERLNITVKTLQDQISLKNTNADLFAKALKQSMNSLYHAIMDDFEENSTYAGNHIKAVLSQKLKTSTLGIIDQFNKDFRDATDNEDSEEVPPHIPEFSQ